MSNKNRFSRSFGGRSDDESEDEETRQPQFITGFGEEGIEYKDEEFQRKEREKAKPKVIPVPSSSHWLQERIQKRDEGREGNERIEGKNNGNDRSNASPKPPSMKYGLNLPSASTTHVVIKQTTLKQQTTLTQKDIPETSTGVAETVSQETTTTTRVEESTRQQQQQQQQQQQLPAEVRLVLEETKRENDPLARSDSGKVISVASTKSSSPEDSAAALFKKQMGELPSASQVEEYAEMPVEEFGAAMLRGMGWNNEYSAKDAFDVNRRPTFLGMGAKPLEEEIPELGSWGKKNPRKQMYIPLRKRPSEMGRTQTEEDGRRKGESSRERNHDRSRSGSYERERERNREHDERDRHSYRRSHRSHRSHRSYREENREARHSSYHSRRIR